MKKDIHPNYTEVVFEDISSKFRFLTRSTSNAKDKTVWEDGKEYPLIKVEVSSQSHPFYTGKRMLIDNVGRIDKFNKRYSKKA